MRDLKNYGFRARLDMSYEQAVERTRTTLKKQGFGVLTEIDVKATLKEKLDVDFRKYVILAHQALDTEMEIGLFLPCNVIVYEENDGSVVSIVDPPLHAERGWEP